eukprot:gnl/Dysnectes_brevis/14019_a33025_99.p1 GENE.gnl/Dysnectes_brevis/14019_a33025_99~~gnl/Dysnectes_brevis/14019_a33025_99.p1  ORF type:complete len:106 (+),score=13.34 gnl/Dysnectes_brevis/14019_a33025_99:116-433(+)
MNTVDIKYIELHCLSKPSAAVIRLLPPQASTRCAEQSGGSFSFEDLLETVTTTITTRHLEQKFGIARYHPAISRMMLSVKARLAENQTQVHWLDLLEDLQLYSHA